MRFNRDKRGYETTALVESGGRRRGRGQRLLYWFRTPPGVRVGRAAIDDEAMRLLEQHNPDVQFDWPRLLKEPAPEPAPRRERDTRDRRDRREPRPGQRPRPIETSAAAVPPLPSPDIAEEIQALAEAAEARATEHAEVLSAELGGADFADATDYTGATDYTDSTEQTGAADYTDTTEQTGATEYTDSTEQTGATEYTDGTERAGATDYTDSTERTVASYSDVTDGVDAIEDTDDVEDTSDVEDTGAVEDTDDVGDTEVETNAFGETDAIERDIELEQERENFRTRESELENLRTRESELENLRTRESEPENLRTQESELENLRTREPEPANRTREREPENLRTEPEPEPENLGTREPENLSAAAARLGVDGVDRLRARYLDIVARLDEKPLEDAVRAELKATAERLNPDSWRTADEVGVALEQYETVFESLRAVVGRHPRRRV